MTEEPRSSKSADIISLSDRRNDRPRLVGTRSLDEVQRDNARRAGLSREGGDGGSAVRMKEEAEARRAHWETVGFLRNKKNEQQMREQISDLANTPPHRIALSAKTPNSMVALSPCDALKFFKDAGEPTPSGREKLTLLENFLSRNFPFDPFRGHPKFSTDPMTGMSFIEWTMHP